MNYAPESSMFYRFALIVVVGEVRAGDAVGVRGGFRARVELATAVRVAARG